MSSKDDFLPTSVDQNGAEFVNCFEDDNSPSSRLSIQVTVVLQRVLKTSGRWQTYQWSVVDVITGEAATSHGHRTLISQDDSCSRYLCGGLRLNLFQDAAEGCWYNLLSDIPYLFVVCDGEESDAELSPRFVSVNQDEATAHMESDDVVLSMPMPAALCEHLERYVVKHYRPEMKKKRKRRDWLSESEYAQKSRR